jgi:hypothetical protein
LKSKLEGKLIYVGGGGGVGGRRRRRRNLIL